MSRYERNPCPSQVFHVHPDPAERAAKGIQGDDLRPDVRADSLPMQILRILVRKIEPPRFRPIETKLVGVAASRDVRMAPCRNIGIHTNRNIGNSSALLHCAFRFLEQNLKLRFGFHVEQENSTVAIRSRLTSRRGRILQCFLDLVPCLPHPRKNNTIAANSEMPQMLQLSPGKQYRNHCPASPVL